MANWILFTRDLSGKPFISAMQGEGIVKQINSELKADLITFLTQFPDAGTFLVAKSDNPSEPIEAVDRLPEDDPNAGTSATTPAIATWFYFLRDDAGQPVVAAMNGTIGVEIYRGNLKETLISFLNEHSGATTFQVAPAGTPLPVAPEVTPPIMIPTGHRVLLEVGHGPSTKFDPGAIAPDGTTEHDLNIIAANAAREVLDQAGVFCTVIDTPQGSLHTIVQASGFDVFCSIHHNAFNKNTQGTEALVHKTKANAPDRELAKMIAKEVATELGIPLRRGDGVNATRSLGVLSGAEDTNVQVAVLAEVYFMDVPGLNLKEMSTRGGKAIGRAILKWLEKNPKGLRRIQDLLNETLVCDRF